MKESSYNKGIKRKLEKQKDVLEYLIIEYILRVNSRYRSQEFPSTQVAKILLKQLGNRDSFATTHRLVRDILREWDEKRGWCQKIAVTKYGHCRKTKTVYRFSEEGLQALKQRLIDFRIDEIERDTPLTTEEPEDPEIILRTRDELLDDLLDNYELRLAEN